MIGGDILSDRELFQSDCDDIINNRVRVIVLAVFVQVQFCVMFCTTVPEAAFSARLSWVQRGPARSRRRRQG